MKYTSSMLRKVTQFLQKRTVVSLFVIVGVVGIVPVTNALIGNQGGSGVVTSPTLVPRVTIQKIESQRASATVTASTATKKPSVTKPVVAKNRIVIPRMGVNTELLEGKTTATLNRGIWHLPGSPSPDKGGNMVIAGHRYKWLPPSTKTFWSMDKMVAGDQIFITWNGKQYTYTVKEITVVNPTKVEILDNTPDQRLTLFTCTPKYTSKYRLVVVAYPDDTTH